MTDRVPLVAVVAVGGAVGAVVRHAITVTASSDRVATLVVNLVGSLAIGLLVARAPSERVRALLGAGVLGGFTTMSAVAVDAAASDLLPALASLAVTLVGGVALCQLGLRWGGREVSRAHDDDAGGAP